jgi:hypothetical protein
MFCWSWASHGQQSKRRHQPGQAPRLELQVGAVVGPWPRVGDGALEPDAHARAVAVVSQLCGRLNCSDLHGGGSAVGPPGPIAGADPDGSVGELLHVLHPRVPLQLAAQVAAELEDLLGRSVDHGLGAVGQGFMSFTFSRCLLTLSRVCSQALGGRAVTGASADPIASVRPQVANGSCYRTGGRRAASTAPPPVAGSYRRLTARTASSNDGSGLISGSSNPAASWAVMTSAGPSLVISALEELTSQTSSPTSRPGRHRARSSPRAPRRHTWRSRRRRRSRWR